MTTSNRPLVATFGLVAATGLLLVACSSGGSDDDGADGQLGPISQRVTALEEQFDADVLSSQTNAMEEHVADCMKAQGFDYTPQRQDSAALASRLDLPDRSTMEFAEQYGYGITTIDDGSEAEQPEQPSAVEMSAEYREALAGKDYLADPAGQMPGGCSGEAMTEVFGADVTSLDTTVAADIAGLQTKADSDAKVVAALDKWSTCMDGQGYDATTPDAAMTSIASKAYDSTGAPVQGEALSSLRTEEIDTAVADLGCRDSSGLTQARAQALASLEIDYYSTHKDQVDAYLDQLEEILKAK